MTTPPARCAPGTALCSCCSSAACWPLGRRRFRRRHIVATRRASARYFDQAYGLAVEADRTILVSNHRYVDGLRTAAVIGYGADGDPDPSFGSNGVLDTGLPVLGDEVGGSWCNRAVGL